MNVKLSPILLKMTTLAAQMKPTGMRRTTNLIILLFLLIVTQITAQKPYVQIQGGGGYSMPMVPISDPHHFSENGYNINAGFSMFFGNFGFMTRGGYQRFAAYPGFQRFVQDKYKEDFKGGNNQYWTNAYGKIGPVFKWSIGRRVDLDFYVLAGMAQLTVPNLVFRKNFFGEDAEIASYYGKNDELIPFWSGGINAHFRLYKGLALTIDPHFVSNQFFSSTLTTFRYVNANDNNNNGYIDDVEFSEAEIKREITDVFFSNLNLNVGLSYQFGREEKKTKPVSMIDVESLEEKEKAELISKEEKKEEISKTDETPVVEETGINEKKPEAKNDEIVVEEKQSVAKDSSKTTMDEYGEAEAQFLYKAGELYYQNNDFENAVACFNKLKNNDKHIMAKYMFSLSLCEMLNCEEAAKEYADFEKKYTGNDSGVFYTVFKSQFEKCRKTLAENEAMLAQWEEENKANPESKSVSSKINNQPQTSKDKNQSQPSEEGENETIAETGTTYRIQFVALKISNKTFPRLENIGKITHEFYPRKSMFRYTLGPYTSEDEAVSDMLKVRAMGFGDAFLAEYKEGQRTNTLYHAR